MLIYNELHCIQFAFYANTQSCQLVPQQHSIYYCTIMKSDPILTLDHTKNMRDRCIQHATLSINIELQDAYF